MPDDDPDPQHCSIEWSFLSVARTLNYLQIRDLEAELDEERKQRQAAVNAKKKLETDYKGLCYRQIKNTTQKGLKVLCAMKLAFLTKTVFFQLNVLIFAVCPMM